MWNKTGDVVTVSNADGELVLEHAYPTPPTDVQNGPVRIAEFQPDAPGNDWENLTEEYVALENEGPETVDLAGWRVEDDANHAYQFPDGTELAPGETITLRTGSGTDTDSTVYWGYGRPVWNNDGDTISLYDEDGKLVLRESY
ncbi:lamin tail domain-containing protein [Natrarchaeobius chitinivorans]|uniref:Lamin tail domain-containing protein n=1 Tax=Natrarchaeobius chitinivorans TaxID=1679083 RepID=A0A3N6LYS3_NATCH|nr:lamin tail domain-containing protein [Natrarchaeobius chitinivorans]